MSQAIQSVNGTCPCKPCQAVRGLGPRQREMRRRRKVIMHHIEQMDRIRTGKGRR